MGSNPPQNGRGGNFLGRKSSKMPPPGCGKGTAFDKPGVSHTYQAEERIDQVARSVAVQRGDSELEKAILNFVDRAKLDPKRKAHAFAATRDAIQQARKGHAPQPVCLQSCKCQGGRQLNFLCLQRERASKVEEPVVNDVRRGLEMYVRGVRAQLLAHGGKAAGEYSHPRKLASPSRLG
jgi:hypothetical protein